MVVTTEIAPTLSLAPFISRYVFREFNTDGVDVFKPWVAGYEMSIHFFFKALALADPFLKARLRLCSFPNNLEGATHAS